MQSSVGVVGAAAAGKTSFVRALGATETVTVTGTTQRQLSARYLWPRPGGNGRKKTTVRILRGREEAVEPEEAVFVLLFDLARKQSLAAVIAQWAHLSDVPARRLMLVGTHADGNT